MRKLWLQICLHLYSDTIRKREVMGNFKFSGVGSSYEELLQVTMKKHLKLLNGGEAQHSINRSSSAGTCSSIFSLTAIYPWCLLQQEALNHCWKLTECE